MNAKKILNKLKELLGDPEETSIGYKLFYSFYPYPGCALNMDAKIFDENLKMDCGFRIDYDEESGPSGHLEYEMGTNYIRRIEMIDLGGRRILRIKVGDHWKKPDRIFRIHLDNFGVEVIDLNDNKRLL